MATYSDPSTQTILDLTGISVELFDLTSQQLTDLVTTVLPFARAHVKARVGKTEFESAALEDYQVSLLQLSVANQVRVILARRGATEKTLGIHQPLTMEDADSILDLAERLENEGEEEAEIAEEGTDPTEQQVLYATFERDDTAETDTDRVFRRNVEVYPW